MTYIYDEIPSGTINGTNVTFTTADSMDTNGVIDLLVDGVEYFSYTITNATTLTLTDAPTVSIRVSYRTPDSSEGEVTIGSVLETIYNILGETNDSTVFDIDWLTNLVNDIQDDICRGTLIDPTTREYVTAPHLPFIEKKYFFITTDDAELGSDITTASTTITVDEYEDWDSPTGGTKAYIEIEGDIISYQGRTNGSLTTCAQISASHDSTAKVRLIHKMPTDIMRGFEIFVSGHLDPIPYRDSREIDPHEPCYTILKDNNNNEFFALYGFSAGKAAIFKYYHIPTDYSTLVNNTIPDVFVLKTIPRLVAGIALQDRDEEEKGLRQEIRGINEVRKMYSFYSQRVREFRKIIPLAKKRLTYSLNL